MKKNLLLVLIVFLSVTGQATAYDDEDFQVWNTDVEELKVSPKAKIALEEEFRWGDNASDFFYQHYDLGFFYSLNKHLAVGVGYRQIFEKKQGKMREENDPYITLTLSFDKNGYSLESRSRFEYRYFDYQRDSWRYRNKFTLKLPYKFSCFEIQPYLSDEIFANFASASNQFNQNRAQAGIAMKLTSFLKAEIYYMRVTVRGSGAWKGSNVLGTKFKVTF